MCLSDFTRDLFEEVAWKICAIEWIKLVLLRGGREEGKRGTGGKIPLGDREVVFLGFICPLYSHNAVLPDFKYCIARSVKVGIW